MAILNEEMSTPTLFKLDSKGVTRVWRAWSTLNEDGTATENNESGIEGGKLSGIPVVVTAGKNIGKKNETTPLQQANTRIESKYTKKLREGYVESLEEFTQQGVMAAHSWAISKHRMSQIALQQPKLDGIRCKVSKDVHGATLLLSKSNKEFKEFLYRMPWAQYLSENLEPLEEIDGEMYIHGLELNEIASLVMSYKYNQGEMEDLIEDTDDGLLIKLKAKEILDQVYTGAFQPEAEVREMPNGSFKKTDRLSPDHGALEVGRNKGWIFPGVTTSDIQVCGSSDLQYWAFDCPNTESTAEERNFTLAERWSNSEDHQIIAVVAEEFNLDDIEEVNAEHVSNGFEGTMVRLPSGHYAFGERTAALLKYKLFHDAEWDIQGCELDREGNPTFIFISDAGVEFKCRPTGTRAWRAKLLADMDELIGKRATLRYQKLFEDTLVPQFARVVSIREYE